MKCTTIVRMSAIVLAAGCVPTLQPVYTQRDLIFEADVLGVWRQQDSTATWDLAKTGENEYALAYTDPEGHNGKFTARLANIGGVKFLDLIPIKEDVKSSEFYKFHLMPIHTVYLVRQTSPNLQLSGFNIDWLDLYLAENPQALSHSTYNGHRLITASTKELQAFLLEHQDQFTANFELVRASQ